MVSVVLAAVALAGCGQDEDIRFQDSVDFEFDLFRHSDHLNTPYVVGAQFEICADTPHKRQLRGTRLQSSNPSVFLVGDSEVSSRGDHICATAEALDSGPVEIQVVDDGDVIASADLEVFAPDRAELLAAGPILSEQLDDIGHTARPKILEGGTATFLVSYFHGETSLSGNGALIVSSDEGLSLEVVQTVVFEDREWLRITANSLGVHDIELATPAGMFETVTVETVDEEAVIDVALLGSDETDIEKGTPLLVYAQAYDEDDDLIFGVEYEWSLADGLEPGTGDLFSYNYDEDHREDLVARHGDLDATVEIRAGEGRVDSSNNQGCSVGGRSGGTAALFLLGLIGLRRRRFGR